MAFHKGQDKDDTGATVGRRFRPDRAAVLLNDRTADGQADAQTVAFRRMKGCE